MNISKSTHPEQYQLLTVGKHYHQQYLAKNPNGYCGLSGCGISYSEKL